MQPEHLQQMADQHSSLGNESSNEVVPSLPSEVVTCLKNARFLHLATCDNNCPHVSLMNYTYLPSTPFDSRPVIVMTTSPSSKKTTNLINNPQVSILVHDWISHRPPTRAPDPERDGSPPPAATRSSLATLLLNLNTSAMSSISVTMNGIARLVSQGTDEEKWYKDRHLANNDFEEQPRDAGGIFWEGASSANAEADGGKRCFIESDEVRVVVARITNGRVSDYRGRIKDWDLAAATMVNGTTHD